MEATETPSLVLEYYDELLRTDPTNAVGFAQFWVEDKSLQVTHNRLSGNDAYLFFAA